MGGPFDGILHHDEVDKVIEEVRQTISQAKTLLENTSNMVARFDAVLKDFQSRMDAFYKGGVK